MRRSRLFATLAAAIATVSVFAVSRTQAEARMVFEEDFRFQPTFQLDGTPIGGNEAPKAAPAHLVGSTIAALDGGALVIDSDSGQLVRVDDKGNAVARLDIAAGAGQVVFDAAASRAYVSDRRGDEIVVVEVGKKKLVEKARWATAVEPWGLALSPDGKTLLVTTIADRTLAAFDTGKGKLAWQRGLSREPRGVAISPDGTTALVGYLGTGTVERIDLSSDEHVGSHVPLVSPSTQGFNQTTVTGFVPEEAPARPFARAAFAVRFIGNGVGVVGFQESTPIQLAAGMGENTGSYGGGFEAPIVHRIAFLGAPEGAEIPRAAARVISHQPNAIGWDGGSDRMVIAGYGSDDLLVLSNASQTNVALERHQHVGTDTPCGPDGVAVSGDKAWVWCSLSRQVVAVNLADGGLAVGPSVTDSKMSELERRGLALFRVGNDARVSVGGAMSCSNCHPDVRTDGLSWRIESHELQTPLLAGRVANTAPYKWDGGDHDLVTSLTGTMRRLGGSGLSEDENLALAAYLESIPAVRRPQRDKQQVARGKKLFKDDELGCDTCHSGKRFSDNTLHALGGDLANVDTPSLVGVAASAPYYHDGSAATLDALLRDTALVHGMTDLDSLDEKQIADLVAYLETL